MWSGKRRTVIYSPKQLFRFPRDPAFLSGCRAFSFFRLFRRHESGPMGRSPLGDSAANIAALARSLETPYQVLGTMFDGQALMAKKIADLDKSPP